MKIITEIPDELVSAFYKSNITVGLEQYMINLLASSLYAKQDVSEKDVDVLIENALKNALTLKKGTAFVLRELVPGFVSMPHGFRRQLGKDFHTRAKRHNAEQGHTVFEFNHKPGRTEITKII
jgi:hypothetical protein